MWFTVQYCVLPNLGQDCFYPYKGVYLSIYTCCMICLFEKFLIDFKLIKKSRNLIGRINAHQQVK